MQVRRYGLVASLHEDPDAVASYERYHAAIWPEVIADGHRSGAIRTAIFRDGFRLFMVMDTTDAFDLDRFGSQESSPRTSQWQQIMDGLLLDQPGSPRGTKWRPVTMVCDVE